MRSRYVPKHARVRRTSTTRVAALTGAALTSAAVVTGGAIAPASAAPAAPAVAVAPAGTGYHIWDQVAYCETHNHWDETSAMPTYSGGLGFANRYWGAFGGYKFSRMPYQATREQQIIVAQNILKVNGPGAWPVCGPRAGLTRTNGLAVKVYGGTTTTTTTRTTSVTSLASSRLVIDGSYGRRSQAVTQRWLGRGIDGSMSRNDYRALQRKVGVYPDGYFGPKSTAALQRYLGISRDGLRLKDSPRTVRAFQKYLNAKVF